MMKTALASWTAMLVLHEVLAWHMADSHVVSNLLSPGAHTPVVSLLVAVGFVLLRLALILVMPGLIAAMGVTQLLRFSFSKSGAVRARAARDRQSPPPISLSGKDERKGPKQCPKA